LKAASELDSLRVVLVAPRNPLNVGAAARAMGNVGFRSLRVVNPWQIAFREARSAVGASPLLAAATEHASLAEAIADCPLVLGTTTAHNRQPVQPVHLLPKAARLVRRALARGPVALLFGSEKRGLSNQDLSHCHWLLRIPTSDEAPSMNLGQAVAVCLYEIARSPQPRTMSKTVPPASAGQVERITQLLHESLTRSGYFGEEKAEIGEEKLRRILRRQKLSATDAELWLGMLRQILWKVKKG